MDTDEPIEELVICRLTTSPENDDYQAALAETDRWLANQPGFLWRTPGYSSDGRLVDRCGWKSLTHAEAAGAAFLGSEAGRAFGAFLDPVGMVFLHYRPARKV